MMTLMENKMDTNQTIDFFNDLDDFEQVENFLEKSQRRLRYPPRNLKKLPASDETFLHAQDDSASHYKFTYKAARFEEWWLLDSLGDFYEHKWISDVTRRVKGGKEASVYMCRPGSEVDAPLIAAKVYRPRSLRNLKNDGMYRAGRADLDGEGNQIINRGMAHAMEKKTEYGKELLHQSWIAYEFTSLERLHAAGVDVPKPYTMAKNAILMRFIGDEDGCAPTLNEVSLDRKEAKDIFDRVLQNIDIALSHNLVHGDLSAYNILYWEGSITFIDFPQVVAPQNNRTSFAIFQRDVSRVCEYFFKQGVKANPRKIAFDLWQSHGFPVKEDVDVKYLDANNPDDLAYWKKHHK
jgi:RIO kinase 1